MYQIGNIPVERNISVFKRRPVACHDCHISFFYMDTSTTLEELVTAIRTRLRPDEFDLPTAKNRKKNKRKRRKVDGNVDVGDANVEDVNVGDADVLEDDQIVEVDGAVVKYTEKTIPEDLQKYVNSFFPWLEPEYIFLDRCYIDVLTLTDVGIGTRDIVISPSSTLVFISTGVSFLMIY